MARLVELPGGALGLAVGASQRREDMLLIAAAANSSTGLPSKYNQDVAFLDVAHLRALTTGLECVCQQHGSLLIHPPRYHRRADIGEWHADEFRLAAVVSTTVWE